MNGAKHIILRVHQPRLGVVDTILFDDSERVLHETLGRVLAGRNQS